ncbi:unnamed protein product [Fraxinus pennsylvanica]|uniref:Enoyl reductase (ER) domain-containing protein n=1 Tax=Fraxinus pennsylvanica TaxID=56036 RepID=A0AAD2E8I1_9LAMI|nr:unnamed protein product [Fraxinus pennsylvanica]
MLDRGGCGVAGGVCAGAADLAFWCVGGADLFLVEVRRFLLLGVWEEQISFGWRCGGFCGWVCGRSIFVFGGDKSVFLIVEKKAKGNGNTRDVGMAEKLMHAVRYDSYGGGASGLKHVEVPVPTPGEGEVLLNLEARSLNPVDRKTQKGMLRPLFPRKFPFIPVTDVAGEVVEVGPEVKNFKAGDKVVAYLGPLGGGLGEYAIAKVSLTVPRPPEVSPAEGAGLAVAGLTAHMALTQSAGVKLDGSGPRKNILITAASGGVGHYAVQLAKLGNTRISWSVFEPSLNSKGKVIDITPGLSSMWTFAVKKLTFSKKQLVPLLVAPNGENLNFLVNLVKEGKLKTIIDSKHPLSKAEDAWAKIIDGHATGKIIIEP